MPKIAPVIPRPTRQTPARLMAGPAVAAKLEAPLVLKSPALSGRRFSFAVPGVAGSKYAVEASTNLATWVRVMTNRVPFTFMETNTGQPGKRFFRTVRLP